MNLKPLLRKRILKRKKTDGLIIEMPERCME